MKLAVAAFCVLTLSAAAFLTPLFVNRTPRTSFTAWALMANLFGAESVLAVVALAFGLAAPASWLRYAVFAGAAAALIAGALWVNATLSASP